MTTHYKLAKDYKEKLCPGFIDFCCRTYEHVSSCEADAIERFCNFNLVYFQENVNAKLHNDADYDSEEYKHFMAHNSYMLAQTKTALLLK